MTQATFYRVDIQYFHKEVSKCGFNFGEIKGRHKDEFTARREADKVNSKGLGIKQAVFQFTTDSKLSVGDKAVDLTWAANVARIKEREISKCAEIIEAMRTGVSSEEACKYLYPTNEFDEDMEFDPWCDKFSEDALKLIEEKEKAAQERAEKQAKHESVVDSFENAADQITYSFPAVKGVQANKEYYVAQVPFKYLVRFFQFADESLPAELRAQRKVNTKHAEDIREYVVSNRNDYVLPSLTASVDRAMVFDALDVTGLSDRLGVLRIPVDSTILLNDGQHRTFAAKSFIQDDKTLMDETISVVFHYDQGLEKSKQIFADLNANLSKPSAAINALYDLRNPFNKFVLDALERHPELNKLIDKENTTIGAKSANVWSLIHWKKFVSQLLNVKEKTFGEIEEERLDVLNNLFDLVVTELTIKIRLWGEVIRDEISSEDLRILNVAGHAVYLESLAVALSDVITGDDEQLVKDAIDKIGKIPTAKDAQHWADRCVVGGRMAKSVDNVKLTAAYMREVAELEVSDSMKDAMFRHGLK